MIVLTLILILLLLLIVLSLICALRKTISSDADEQASVEFLVAELDEEVIGSVALLPVKSDVYKRLVDMLDYPEIRMLAVKAELRGKGVAEALIKDVFIEQK